MGPSSRRNALRPVLQHGTGRGGRGGDGGADNRPSGREGGPAIGPLAILAGAGLVLVILLGIILVNQGEETRQETAPPCIQASVPEALDEIADGTVTNIRASAASNDLSQFAVAVELDIEGGGCLSLPQGSDTVDARTAVLGAATIYNSQTEGRRINIEIRGVEVPPTPTPAPTETPIPTVEPTIEPTVPVVIPPAPAGTPDAGIPVATPLA
ncbi:MAG TPA: hypothetical protein VGT61_00265 [Thermomicrobiales bacterium]|nr:hypothetical protein [Thermomicrobiales bacterium]